METRREKRSQNVGTIEEDALHRCERIAERIKGIIAAYVENVFTRRVGLDLCEYLARGGNDPIQNGRVR